MTAPRKDIVAKVTQWVSHAEDDLRLARHGMKLPEDCPYELIAFHAQQCAEKYLKAYLVSCLVDFPYTHDIFRLLRLCRQRADWAGQLEDAGRLVRYAITARYPTEGLKVNREQAAEAIAIAQRVAQVVREALTAEGILLS